MKVASYPNRTQISLSPELKSLIESRGAALGESLSEYLRKAAILRLTLDEVDKRDLELLADITAGSVPKSQSGWKNIKDVSRWQHNLRKDEDQRLARISA